MTSTPIIEFLIKNKVILTMLGDSSVDEVEGAKWILAHKHGVSEDDIEMRMAAVWDADLECMVRNLLETIPSSIDGIAYPKVILEFAPVQGEDF